jgi:hypothetical protein
MNSTPVNHLVERVSYPPAAINHTERKARGHRPTGAARLAAQDLPAESRPGFQRRASPSNGGETPCYYVVTGDLRGRNTPSRRAPLFNLSKR